MDNTQNIISICSGYSGLELGIKRAGVDVRTVCYLEIEVYVQAVLVKAMEEGRLCTAPVWSNAKTFPASEFRGKVHGITAGYPCQPFSSAGKRKGEEDPRHLWPYIREHVRAIRPVWCFFENVRGHTTMGLWRVLSDLEEDGYRTEWGLFSAEETGAPHQRIRMFILGYAKGARLPRGIMGSGKEQLRGTGPRDRELAHTASREPRQSQARNGGQDIGGGSEEPRWPARPGEEQYEWEEPRVVADSKHKRSVQSKHSARCGEELFKDGESTQRTTEAQSNDEAQSELGGAVDGSACGVDATTNRVDRLRLLGNGVVPQTAELAWRTLWKEIEK